MNDVTDRLEELRFSALRNALYHTFRRDYLDRVGRISNFTIIVLGTTSASQVLGVHEVSNAAVYLGVATAIVGALQLVYDFAGRARTHEILQRRYYNILSDIEMLSLPDEMDMKKIDSEMIKTSGEEPPMLRALDAISYNAAADALEYPHDQKLFIPVINAVFSNVLSFSQYNFKRFSEITYR